MTEHAPFQPNWIVHPGTSVADALEEQGLSRTEAAKRLRVTIAFLNDLVDGKVAICPDTAASLANVLGSTAEFWLRLQENYETESTRLQDSKPKEGETTETCGVAVDASEWTDGDFRGPSLRNWDHFN